MPNRNTPATMYLRVPRGLHAQLKELAAVEGVALNALVMALLASGVGYTLNERAGEQPALEEDG